MNSADADLLNFSAHARLLLGLMAIAWLVHAINFNGWLNKLFGLRPRNLWGLLCIFTRPFLHGSTAHLIGNTIGFVPLAWLVMLQGIHLFYFVTISLALLSGLSLWFFGNAKYYVGASSVIFGYLGFLLIYGVAAGSFIALIIAAVAASRDLWRITGDEYNGSQVLPGSRGAWMGHLSGFIAGMLLALVLSDMRLS